MKQFDLFPQEDQQQDQALESQEQADPKSDDQFPAYMQPEPTFHFNEAHVMMFRAVKKMSEVFNKKVLNEQRQAEHFARIIRERAVSHGIDPVAFTLEYHAWNKTQE
jgi:hypothetical protein